MKRSFKKDTVSMKLTILFDNEVNVNKRNLGLIPLWGFSLFIETEDKSILFDTGSNGRVLLKNALNLGIDLSRTDMLFISHPHWDHIGGWDSVTEINSKMRIVVPQSLSKHLTRDMRRFAKEVIVINDSAEEICSGIFSTGTMQPEGEQALVFETDYGLIIIAGCSHPKIENFIVRAKEIFPQKSVYYIIGGFHLFRQDKAAILSSMQRIDTQYITPTHCTGDLATQLFQEYFADKFISGGVGQSVILPFK